MVGFIEGYMLGTAISSNKKKKKLKKKLKTKKINKKIIIPKNYILDFIIPFDEKKTQLVFKSKSGTPNSFKEVIFGKTKIISNPKNTIKVKAKKPNTLIYTIKN